MISNLLYNTRKSFYHLLANKFFVCAIYLWISHQRRTGSDMGSILSL